MLGIQADLSEGSLTVGRCMIAALNAFVGVLFLIREPIQEEAPIGDLLKALGSFLICGFVFKQSLPLSGWSVSAHVLLSIGAAIAIWSFFYLGRSFAIFPARRSLRSRGPYRWIRHPAYLGELLMVVACVVAVPSFLAFGLLIAAFALTAWRIHVEERFLAGGSAYRAYQDAVAYRLIPKIW